MFVVFWRRNVLLHLLHIVSRFSPRTRYRFAVGEALAEQRTSCGEFTARELV